MDNIDYKAADVWLGLAQWAATGILAVWTYLRTQDRDNADAVKAVGTKVEEVREAAESMHADLNLRLATVEERIKHMPTQDELARIEGDVAEVRAKLGGLEELLRRVEHQTNLIHQHLLTGR